jgi:hypothetical protein
MEPWFKPWGWIHRPSNVAGWLLTLLTLGLIAGVFAAVDQNSRFASDTLMRVFPWAWSFLATLNWVAAHSHQV